MITMPSRTPTIDGEHRTLGPSVLLVGLLAVCTAATLIQPATFWPLMVLPIAFSMPLAGFPGLAFAGIVSGIPFGAVEDRTGIPVAALVVAWCTTVAAALLVGARYTKVYRDYERIAGASMRDRLTGLYNFAYFSDALRRECLRTTRYGGSLSLVLLDLDGFKSFNDTYGHATGNVLLAEVGAVMQENRRGTDIVARFGGEEFALLVPGPASMAAEAAERIRVAISRIAVDVGNGEVDGRTISAGVASFVHGDSPDALVQQADQALYLSKRRGRNRVSVSGATELRDAVGA